MLQVNTRFLLDFAALEIDLDKYYFEIAHSSIFKNFPVSVRDGANCDLLL